MVLHLTVYFSILIDAKLASNSRLVKLHVETRVAQSAYQIRGCGFRDVSLLHVILRFSLSFLVLRHYQ